MVSEAAPPPEHPPPPVPPLPHFSPPVPPLLAPSAPLPPRCSFPAVLALGSDYTFPAGTGRSRCLLPTFPPYFPFHSSGEREGSCSPGIFLTVSLSCPPGESWPSVSSPRGPTGSSKTTRLSQTQGMLHPFSPRPSPLSPWAAASSDAGAETEFLGSFGKTLIIYGDFSSCPAAALRGAGTLNTNVVYFRVDLIYIKLQLWCGQHRQGWRAIPAPTRACSGPASQLPSLAQLLEVELVEFPVAADVSPQAQRQAAVALTGQVGAPGAPSCGTRGAQGQPRLWGRGVTPFSRALLTAGEPATVPLVAVQLCLGIAVTVQEVFVASIVQLAASAQEIEALGDGIFSPSPHKRKNIQERVRTGGF